MLVIYFYVSLIYSCRGTINYISFNQQENGRSQDMHIVDEIAPETKSPKRSGRSKCKNVTA